MAARAPADEGAFTAVIVQGDTARATVAAAHAHQLCDGHFPGDALVPGASLAGLMADLAARLPGAAGDPIEVVRCVFLAPVRPHVPIEIRADRADAGATVDAEVWTAGACAARARFRFGPP